MMERKEGIKKERQIFKFYFKSLYVKCVWVSLGLTEAQNRESTRRTHMCQDPRLELEAHPHVCSRASGGELSSSLSRAPFMS